MERWILKNTIRKSYNEQPVRKHEAGSTTRQHITLMLSSLSAQGHVISQLKCGLIKAKFLKLK